MLPNPKNAPLGRPQRPRHQEVARLVAGEFIFPERAVAFWLRPMLGTTMPETAVHKDGEFDFWKNKSALEYSPIL